MVLPKFGPPRGFRIPGDLKIEGNVDCSGTFTRGVDVVNHAIDDDIQMAAGRDITTAAGDGKFDFHNGTGIFKTSTGTNTLYGDVVITGAKKLDTGTGKTTINGDLDLAASSDVVGLAGDGLVDFSLMTGIFKTPTGAVTIGPGAVGITGDTTIAADKKLIAGPIAQRMLAKTADYVIKDTDPDIVVVGAITALANATFTLPTLSANQGRIITVIVAGDPGTHDVVLDGEGAETINGAATKTNSTQYALIQVLATPAEWVIVGLNGSTWT
jgi:hypothetical protein